MKDVALFCLDKAFDYLTVGAIAVVLLVVPRLF